LTGASSAIFQNGGHSKKSPKKFNFSRNFRDFGVSLYCFGDDKFNGIG